MSDVKTILGATSLDESWGPALKESGFRYKSFSTMQEAARQGQSVVLMDARQPEWSAEVASIKSCDSPILSVIKSDLRSDELARMKASGLKNYIREEIPAEELVIRLKAMTADVPERASKEARSSQRTWFQQIVEFKVFDKSYTAWSTTLSETGIFLRTNLSFPLYSVIRLRFDLLGDLRPVECDGVIVRQEVEGPIRGLGIMFQNLNGENVRALESLIQRLK
jgi:hypothetical protein